MAPWGMSRLTPKTKRRRRKKKAKRSYKNSPINLKHAIWAPYWCAHKRVSLTDLWFINNKPWRPLKTWENPYSILVTNRENIQCSFLSEILPASFSSLKRLAIPRPKTTKYTWQHKNLSALQLTFSQIKNKMWLYVLFLSPERVSGMMGKLIFSLNLEWDRLTSNICKEIEEWAMWIITSFSKELGKIPRVWEVLG